jgi:hypothetical protein
LVRNESRIGGEPDSPTYFAFIDEKAGFIISGWFEPEERYPGIHMLWAESKISFPGKGLPNSQDESFRRQGIWDVVLYSMKGLPNMRANCAIAGTWIDLHLSLFSASADSSQRLLSYLQAIEVLESSKAQSNREPQQDYSKPAKSNLTEAEKNESKAMLKLGDQYAHGRGVPRDYSEALKWYRLAADKGESGAMYSLGYLYQNGLGVQKDYVEAIKWYTQAAEREDAWAMNNLGYMYEKGEGVPANYNEAAKWYKRAAGCGDAFAMNNLAKMYHDGRGVERNYEFAYVWAALALERASSKAEKDKYIPLAIHTSQELLDPKRFQRAKQLKDELSKSIRVLKVVSLISPPPDRQ